jgi:pimeloyl-ACP methyl ester carboxylesterase
MKSGTKKSVILVHGAFADGTGWQKIIPLLEKEGLTVAAVQLPLKSLADDVATTKRLIDSQPGGVILVGHSYGGAVITEAGAANPKVKGLVYVAAFAPDAGEAVGALIDLPEGEASVLAATQKPLAASIFGEPIKAAAWKNIPSWYVVSTQDQAINPDLERFMAKRMGAKTTEIKASHVSFISSPSVVAKVITLAAASIG